MVASENAFYLRFDFVNTIGYRVRYSVGGTFSIFKHDRALTF